ncbi:hypothetical protein BV25DRAFT_1671014 [Artomyces pyxidatus]|uniref:Uncharacterized protein n=1 Tax=Artomyces pyxidatus TaxID=48021 RepID=A0ACB8SI30_9AGAM|nr:hypothetical protein BV25DRAFT_1671014 [Artomyces pyxidatus]
MIMRSRIYNELSHSFREIARDYDFRIPLNTYAATVVQSKGLHDVIHADTVLLAQCNGSGVVLDEPGPDATHKHVKKCCQGNHRPTGPGKAILDPKRAHIVVGHMQKEIPGHEALEESEWRASRKERKVSCHAPATPSMSPPGAVPFLLYW